MKDKMYILLTLVLILGFSLINDVLASGAPGPPGGGGAPCWPPSTCIPIDGGLSFLLVAGAAYGAKKIYGVAKDK